MTQDLPTISYDEECGCPAESQSNPKKLLKGRRKTGAFGDVYDPVAEELKDPQRAPMIYGDVRIIPFFDNGDATLRVLRRMRELSPTHSSCISNIGDYVFGGELSIRRYVEPGMAFDTEEDTPLTPAEKREFMKFVASLNPEMTFEGLLNDATAIFENLKTYGNAFYRIDEVRIAGRTFYYFEAVDAEKCRYFATERGQDKILVISAEWTSLYMTQYPPEFVDVFPNWSDYGDGRRSTVIHIKNKVVGRDWYGLPDSFGALYWEYLEVQQGQHGTEGYANDFIARVFFEITAEPDTDDDEDNFDGAVERTFTNQASRYGNQPKRYIIRRKLPDDDPATVHEFKSNTDHQYHTGMAALAEREVIKCHNWHSVLLGAPTPGRIGQNEEFKEVYKQKYNSVIRQWQERSLRPIIQAMQACETERDGSMNVTNRLSLGLFNLYAEYLKSEADAVDNAPNKNNPNPNDPNKDLNDGTDV